ncbi:HET-domain-containing protein [Aspergillus bertholletiae]|uniref:HET-domain-containing protein n=1 Tax=Aspergillus bertholletiae TaxID=1226010 RepID=A0A5N7BBC4_9EURO|nr:HET-domain-containing protein [Aspergillus bertholletiae]
MPSKPEHALYASRPFFTYPTLPQEPYITRMIRLLPHKDKGAPIQCELFNYNLSETGGGSHLYEALSYVWGSEVKPASIILDGCTFHVTMNLHSALIHLRNNQLARTLWVDAICINQDEEDQGYEKSKQIPLMRTIYAQADRVIVWLGDAVEDGDKALEGIGRLGERRDTDSFLDTPVSSDAYRQLLRRDWFSRIWVLQEVGVARCISIMCGSVYINGHIFCEGLSRLRLSSDFLSRIGPVAYLINGALYRPKHEVGSYGSLSIGELIGMYQNHDATKQHDKVYALLGLSADLTTTVLEPNYNLTWKEVFKKVINYIFPECSVEAWTETETAVIKSRGWILGLINSVDENVSESGKQEVEVIFNGIAKSLGYQYYWENYWEIQASAALIQDGDIICLLKGALKPTIIRLCKDYFTVITPAVTPQQNEYEESPTATSQESYSTGGLCDILLTWNYSLAKTESDHKPEVMFQHLDIASNYREGPPDAEKRLKHMTLAVVEIATRALMQREPNTNAIKRLLRQSGTEDTTIEDLIMAYTYMDGPVYHKDRSPAEMFSQYLLRCQKDDLPISEETIITAMNCQSYSCIILELFLQHQGAKLPVSEEVLKAAAGNGYIGYRVMEVLFQHRGESLPVSEEVVKAAAGNASEIIEILFQHRGESLPVSEEVVKTAAGNGSGGYKIMETLFQHRGESLPISEEVVKAAAGNEYRVMKVLFQHRGDSLPISEEVVKAAARNEGYSGPEILQVLFKHRGDSLPISEEVVKAAAMNSRQGSEIMHILFQYRGANLPVPEEVAKEVAESYESFQSITGLNFKKRRL